MKKLTHFTLAVLVLLILSACTEDSGIEVTFELSDGEVVDTITMESPGSVGGFPVPEEEGKHFLGWFETDDFREENRFDSNTRVTEDITLYGTFADDGSETPLTDALTLAPSDYEDKDFDSHGIEEVELRSCTDGDTAQFTKLGPVRYLSIDTPESTGIVEEWGIPASEHMCDILQSAETIVIESEPNPEVDKYDSAGGRVLGYVWADGRLTNLEMIELGFSDAGSTPLSQYGDYLYIADINADNLGLRVNGEEDPDFDPERLHTTIALLNDEPDRFQNRFVNLEGWVTKSTQTSLVLNEEPDGSGDSVSIYKAYEQSDNFTEGYQIRIEGLYFRENGELTNLPRADVTALVWD